VLAPLNCLRLLRDLSIRIHERALCDTWRPSSHSECLVGSQTKAWAVAISTCLVPGCRFCYLQRESRRSVPCSVCTAVVWKCQLAGASTWRASLPFPRSGWCHQAYCAMKCAASDEQPCLDHCIKQDLRFQPVKMLRAHLAIVHEVHASVPGRLRAGPSLGTRERERGT